MGIAERRLREKENRRTAIMDAAERVFFANGMDGAIMDDVASAAELSKGLLYFYFKSKDDLAHAITYRGLRVLENMFEEVLRKGGKGLDLTRSIGEAYVRFSREYADYFRLMAWMQSRPHDDVDPGSHVEACHQSGDRCIALTAEAVRRGVEDGSIRPDLNPMETAISLWAQTHGVILISEQKELSEMKLIDADKLIQASLDLISAGLENK